MTLSSRDIDIFFHMRNHYLKLKNAKSTFIFSPNKARIKSSSSLSEKHQKMMEFEEKHFQNQQHLPYYNDDMTTSITCLYHTELNGDPALVRVKRPTTRRNPTEVPPPSNIIVKPRPQFNRQTPYPKTANTANTKKSNNNVDQKSYSSSRNSSCCSVDKKRMIPTRTPSGSVSARSESKKNTPTKNSRRSASLSSRSEIQVETNVMDTNTASSPTSPSKKNGKDNRRNNKVEEHEYLLFLLRVTEDIIMNNYYANEDIDRVFKEHMDINKDRLMKEKMEQHLARLADELHINDVQTMTFETERCTPLSKPAYTNIQTLKTCQCECAPDVPLDMYLYPTEEYNYYNQSYKNNLDEIIYYRHSLGRLTEYTEPTNSSTTVAKAISSCPTKSNNMLLENFELDDPKLKIYDTRSEIFNINRNESEDSLCPSKFLRTAISENIVHQNNIDENAESEINKDRLSKNVAIREKSLRLNKDPNIAVIEEDKNICDEDKDGDQEKVSNVDDMTKNIDKFKCFKSTSEISKKTDSITDISIVCDDSIEKINTEMNKSNVNTDKEEYNTESNLCLSESNSKTYKSDFSTESTEKYDLIGKFRTKRSKSYKEKITITNSVTRKESSTTEYSGFATEVNAESSDINSDKFDEPSQKNTPLAASRPHIRSKFILGQGNEEISEKEIGDFDTGSKKSDSDKNIAERGDCKSEKSDVSIEKYENKVNNDFTAQKVDKCSITDFHLEQLNVTADVCNCEMRLNLEFAKDSIESVIPSPYVETSKSKESKLPLEMDFAIHESKEFKSYTVIPSQPREIDKSVQTSCSKFCAIEKPETQNKSVQMSCTYSSIACCTEDDNDVHENNSDYILITSPVYILKSALNSRKKIIIKKDKFIESEQEIDNLEDIEKRSDIDCDAKSIDLKLLGSDYDLLPERDTTNKPHYLSADVRMPSLSSIQEDRLLLGNLYELHDDSSRENVELGSATYRCMDTDKALSCDDDIFLRNSEVKVNQNWLSDKGEMPRPSQKKRVNKLKHVRASVNVSNSTSSASLTC